MLSDHTELLDNEHGVRTTRFWRSHGACTDVYSRYYSKQSKLAEFALMLHICKIYMDIAHNTHFLSLCDNLNVLLCMPCHYISFGILLIALGLSMGIAGIWLEYVWYKEDRRKRLTQVFD